MADMLASRIVALRDGKVRTVQEGPELQSPARLAWTKSGVIVAPWGYTTGYKTDTPGQLYSWRMEDHHMEPLAVTCRGNWIGLCSDGMNGWFAGDFLSGTIRHIAHHGRCQDMTCLEYGLGDTL